jgi:hypothetical protein
VSAQDVAKNNEYTVETDIDVFDRHEGIPVSRDIET